MFIYNTLRNRLFSLSDNATSKQHTVRVASHVHACVCVLVVLYFWEAGDMVLDVNAGKR